VPQQDSVVPYAEIFSFQSDTYLNEQKITARHLNEEKRGGRSKSGLVNGRRNIEAICLRYGTKSGTKGIEGGRKLQKSQYIVLQKQQITILWDKTKHNNHNWDKMSFTDICRKI
jgi:hypothetical protein